MINRGQAVIVTCNVLFAFAIGIFTYMHSAVGAKWSFVFFVIPLLVSTVFINSVYQRLSFKHKAAFIKIYFCGTFLSLLFGADRNLVDFDIKFSLCLLASSLLGSLIFLFLASHYGEAELRVLVKENAPKRIVDNLIQHVLAKKIEKQIEGKVDPRVTSRVASSLAAGALSESLASGGGALSVDHLTTQAAGLAGAISSVDMGSHFSDDLLSRAMSIADHHIAAFDAGHWQTSGPMGMDTNPATGLPMMGGGIDIGGDAFGSSWHHDHSLSSPSFDSHYSDPFRDSSGGINTGSSFDDFNRY
ncbi:hypothetical protein [Cedecea sp. NFIX57]|uniref:hypothetical protein n=1 Tax=Cedecea sp. NFIX57 TaxID=1566286 RepID=UPI000A0A389A|nr:hypothetical protein [Cedecea sp. NFIX57]SMG60296.1 hypothetical protein SAMN03159353_103511 [Cedecea sp. NFIX57]